MGVGVVVLDDPTDPEAMYLDGESDSVPLARPVMFGDVFKDVACSRGGDSSALVMVLTHPCSMRSGPTALKDTVVTGTITEPAYPGKKAEKWSNGFFDHLPLFGLPDAPDIMGVDFGALHAASSQDLDPATRVRALSNYGVAVALQRWIYQLSRDPVPLTDLEELIAPVMAEVEMQEEWCQVALDVAPADTDTIKTLATSADRIQEVLGKGPGSLRVGLWEPNSRADVRRKVKALRVAEMGR